jgi:hypothetical protein
MATFRSNGAVPLVLFDFLREQLSACSDRWDPTSNARGALESFEASCGGRVDDSFTAQMFALVCKL